MLTLHAAKGLEFERVFIIGLDEMLLPHSRSMDDSESLAEERRLFYVGMTRAKKQLFLVRALRRRSTYGSYEETQASRFLEDIPDQLLQKPASTYRSFSNHYKNTSVPRWEVPAYRTTERASAQKKFATGMQVMHPVYGRGVVRMSRMELGDETVEVFFEGVGLKALVASLANLEII
jgi:DNA helicase-2/ATP-dependent DNA helicase PcrA